MHLPDLLYKSLPYLYVFMGFIFAFTIEPKAVYVLSFLLFSILFLLFWIRYSSKVESERLELGIMQRPQQGFLRKPDNYIQRSKKNRRIDNARHSFPLLDRSGMRISHDRRVKDRRDIMA